MRHRLISLAGCLLFSATLAIAQPAPDRGAPKAPSPTTELPEPVKAALASVVRVTARIPPRARTLATLGSEREGHGVLIGEDGLILTIGYLILEADDVVVGWGRDRRMPASVIAYDHESGFGLIRTAIPLNVPALPLGDSDSLAVKDMAYAADARNALQVLVTSRREFAGYWEYLLDQAIFTTPPHPQFAGMPLLSPQGKLMGVGSLLVQEAIEKGNTTVPGNMFVPINRLKPILADLLAKGRSPGPARPWLGVSVVEALGRLTVINVTAGGPAAEAGLRRGDIIATIAGQPVSDAAQLYRILWALGDAGVDVPLQIERTTVMREIRVKSSDRYKFLRLDSSL